MLYRSIVNLPDELNVYFGDMSDLHGIEIFEDQTATFDDAFHNAHIYGFQATFDFGDLEKSTQESLEIYHNTDIDNARQTEAEFLDFIRGIIKEKNDAATLCWQQLYDIIQLNIKPKESIEICSWWVDNRNIFNFGMPKEKKVIDAEKIYISESLCLKENSKIVIFGTV